MSIRNDHVRFISAISLIENTHLRSFELQETMHTHQIVFNKLSIINVQRLKNIFNSTEFSKHNVVPMDLAFSLGLTFTKFLG